LTEWQPIETAPTDGTCMLLWGRYALDEQGWFSEPLYGQFSGVKWVIWGAGIRFNCRPTHWYSLPDPPNEKAPRAGEGAGGDML